MDHALFELAKERHLAGDLSAARELYDRVLIDEPGNAGVLFRTGVLEIQHGRPASALDWIARAIAIDPAEPRYHQGLAETLAGLKRLPEAASAYRTLLQLKPGSADLHFALGLTLQSQGDHGASIAPYRDALRLRPHFANAQTNLGAALQAIGKTNEALEALAAAVDLEPAVALNHVNLGSCLCQMRRFAEGASVLRRAMELDPALPEAAYNLGVALTGLDQLNDAADAYRAAIRANQHYVNAYNNLGAVLKDLGDFKASAAAFESALIVQPDFLPAYNNLACLLRTLGRMDEAEVLLRSALSRGLKSAAVYSNLGNVLKDGGALDDAIDCYRRAIEMDPQDAGIHGNLVYSLSFQATDGQVVLDEARLWNERHAARLSPRERHFENVFSPNRRLRIGYVSGDFRVHCQSLFTIPLLSHHDRHGFEIFCYSSVERPDGHTHRIKQYVDVWRDVRALDDGELAGLIRDDRIDVLVDLGMHMATGRPLVFARSPAPVQVAWLAYPGTTGIGAIAYRLTDPRLDPDGFDQQYVERTVRLPDTFWCYDPLSDEPVNELPASTRGFVTFGCLNNPCKLTDTTLAMWGRIMSQVPTARLMLLVPAGNPRDRLGKRLREQGINVDRVLFEQFQPRAQYLKSYHGIDLGLDTFPYNGHTTSLDSFWMGVPVVTRVGQTAVGRGGLSQLFNLNLCELAAESSDQFVQIAVALANDLPRLRKLRRELRGRVERSPLMDAARFARSIEASYREMWDAWQCGRA